MFKILSFFSLFLLTSAPWAKAQDGQLTLISSAFENNQDIPAHFTCKGSDINPPLTIQNIPPKTESLALTMTDPDAPGGTWVHWVVYNIKPNTPIITENSIPGKELLNDFGKYHYGGPCPANEKEHHYIFRVYALDQIMDIDEGSTMKEMEKAIRGHILAQSKLTGVYRKPVW